MRSCPDTDIDPIQSLCPNIVLVLTQVYKRFLFFQVHPSFVSQMKTVRQLAVTRLTEFFEFMTDYDFKPICDSVFSTAVWPQVRPCTGH